MNSKVEKTLSRCGMISPGDCVYAAVSGGADSTALLLILYELKNKLSFSLKAVHINHCLRGEESERDERFVRALCERLSVPLTVKRVDVKALSQSLKTGIEEAARTARYEFFDTLCGKVATAHTLNDRAETLLLNIIRGCGISGLRSIPPIRGKYIRPLIECGREEIERYLSKCGQDYCIDSTNLDETLCSRNRVRHRVVPELLAINSAFLSSADRLIKTAERLCVHLENEVCRLDSGDISSLRAADDAVLYEFVRKKCAEYGVGLDSLHTERAVETIRRGGKTQLSDTFFLKATKSGVEFYFNEKAEPFCLDFRLGRVETPYFIYEFRKISPLDIMSCDKINNLLFNFCFDYDKISEHIKLRQRLPGDKIRLFGRGCTKEVRRLYNESGVPEHLRGRLCVLSAGDELIYAQSLGVAEKYAVGSETKNAVLITVINKGDDPH